MKKIAEQLLESADKFPIETLRELLSRKWGMDCVCLSGPDEGKSLVDAVVNQLENRWDRLKSRFANLNQVKKMAIRLSESYMKKDDTKKCIAQLKELGYADEAANGISDYMKSFEMDGVNNQEVDSIMNDVAKEEDSLPAEVSVDAAPAMNEMAEEPAIEEAEKQTVSIEVPLEIVEELKAAINKVETANPDAEKVLGDEHMTEEFGADKASNTSDDPAKDEEVIIEVSDEVVPGEPAEGAEEHIVEGEGEAEEEIVPEAEGSCSACGRSCACGANCKASASEEKEEKSENKKGNESKEEETKEEEGKEEDKKSDEKEPATMKEAASTKQVKVAEEKKINVSNDVGGKEISSKEKAVEAPKTVEEAAKVEGKETSKEKVQDGKTLGNEEKFDAKSVDKSSVQNGKTLGNEEKFDAKKPEVPAGSAPIGHEGENGQVTNELTTKGTIIADIEITSKGIIVTAGNQKKLAMINLTPEIGSKVAEALNSVKLEGDAKAIAKTALAVAKTVVAKEECCKTNSGEVESKNTNNPGEDKKSTAKEKAVEAPKSVEEGMKVVGDETKKEKVQDGKTIGQEEKFNAEEVKKSDVSTSKADVAEVKPEAASKETELTTKGTVIASQESETIKQLESKLASKTDELTIKEARIKCAAVYVSSLLNAGLITASDFAKKLDEVSEMPVQAIQALIQESAQIREKSITASTASKKVATAGSLVAPVVQTNPNESLKDQLVGCFKLTQDMNRLSQ